MLEKKMYLVDHELTQTRRTRYSENMNIVVFACINFELTPIKQKTLIRQGSTHKNTSYNWLVHIFFTPQFSLLYTSI